MATVQSLQSQIATWTQQINSANANLASTINQAKSDCASPSGCIQHLYGGTCPQNNQTGCTNNTNQVTQYQNWLANNQGYINTANAQIAQMGASNTESNLIWWLGGGLVIMVVIFFLGKYNGWWGA